MCAPDDSFTVELLHMCLQNLKHAASHGNIFCASWRPCKRRGISTSSTVTHKCASPSFTDLRPCQMRLGNLFAVAKRISKTFFSSLQMTDMESRPIAASTFFFRLYYTFPSNFVHSCFQSCRYSPSRTNTGGIFTPF